MYWNTTAPRDSFYYVNQWGPEYEASKAIEYINGQKDQKQPFALVVSMNPPHTGYELVPDRYKEIYKDLDVEALCKGRPDIPAKGTEMGDYFRNNIRNYYACITGVDENVGRIIEALKQNNLFDNTIVVFLMLSSGQDLPDVFWNFGDGKSGNTVVQYADQDVFIPTEGLIEEYMPNLKAFLDDNEQYQLEITAPNGHKYGFPYVEEMKGLVLTPGPFVINKTWLDKVGKEVPTTVDEWVDCLKAIRDGGDLNGNGEDDEIPMATWFGATDTFGSYNLFYRFTGAFGCADSYCGGNSYADHLRMVDGKVTFTATDEAFKKTAEFFNMLYEEGLIWNGSFEADESMSFKSSLIKENVAKIGSFGVWGDQEITNQEVHDQYVAVPRLQGEDGMTGFECNYSELQDSSDTAITTTCKFPHVVARFVDYMVGDPEISVTSNWGAIGYNYEKDEDGVLRTPLDENGNYKPLNPEYKNFGEARVNSTTCRGSMIVQNEYYDTVCGYTFDAVKLLEMQKENGKDDIMEEYDTIPRVLMTQEEIQRLAQIQPTVSDIVDRYITTWVTGGVDDASWESYKTELEGAGLSELVEIYQGAVDRAASAAN